MDDASERPHARCAYRGCWVFQQDAYSFPRQQCAGQYPGSISPACGFVAGSTGDIGGRLTKWHLFGPLLLVTAGVVDECAARAPGHRRGGLPDRFQAGVGHLRIGDPRFRPRRADVRGRDLHDARIDK